MEEILNEDLAPEQKKTAVVVLGRFQPPHSGHYKVIQQAWKFAKSKGISSLVVVIVDGKKTGEDKVKNPLTADERIRYMEHSGKANWVTKFLTANSAFAALATVRDAGFEPIAIAAGSDRADDYLRILDKYFTKEDGSPIKHELVPGLDRAEDAVDDDKKDSAIEKALDKMKAGGELDVEEASGSMARTAATMGYFDEFVKIVGLEKNKKAAKQMYDKIRAAMGVE